MQTPKTTHLGTESGSRPDRLVVPSLRSLLPGSPSLQGGSKPAGYPRVGDGECVRTPRRGSTHVVQKAMDVARSSSTLLVVAKMERERNGHGRGHASCWLAPLLLLGRWQVGRPPGLGAVACRSRKGMRGISAGPIRAGLSGCRGSGWPCWLLPMRRQVRHRRAETATLLVRDPLRVRLACVCRRWRISSVRIIAGRAGRRPVPGPWRANSARGPPRVEPAGWLVLEWDWEGEGQPLAL
jgi:hypothetical protein